MRIEIQKEEFQMPGFPASLSKTHKIIRTREIMESQFKKLCIQIQIDLYRKERREDQRNLRRAKRVKSIETESN
ncbi:MAG: hypothetical protein HY951_15020 [Bacteroidia bacterium]|nr:hypothetical protein [Bacteroidia bacterium]